MDNSRLAYQREYRAKNREQIRIKRAAYYEKNREKLLAQDAQDAVRRLLRLQRPEVFRKIANWLEHKLIFAQTKENRRAA